jgi:hypothetical protein
MNLGFASDSPFPAVGKQKLQAELNESSVTHLHICSFQLHLKQNSVPFPFLPLLGYSSYFHIN